MARLWSQEHELASSFLPLTNNMSFEKWTRLGRQNHADPQCLSLTSEREQVQSWLELHVWACVTEAACSMALKVGASRCPSPCSTPTAGTQGSHPPPAVTHPQQVVSGVAVPSSLRTLETIAPPHQWDPFHLCLLPPVVVTSWYSHRLVLNCAG